VPDLDFLGFLLVAAFLPLVVVFGRELCFFSGEVGLEER
jgi:hypothetical protein